MRTKYAFRNVASSIVLGILVILIQFVSQWALARALGAEYLGLNSLLITTISLLAVAELGFGAAIVQQLYAPLKKRDWARVGQLLGFYRTIYRMIAAVVIGLGVILLPFLSTIVGDNSLNINIYLVYLLFLLNAVASYLLSYRRSLLHADQKSYRVDIIYTSVFVVVSVVQILMLLATKNYYMFLLGNIVITVVSNIIISIKVSRMYPKVVDGKYIQIDVATRRYTFKQVKGLFYHKTAAFVAPSSSNIIISTLLSLRSVGLASNYLLLSNAITMMTWKISGAITASVGNLLVDAGQSKLYEVYRNLQFGVAVLGALISVVYLVCVDRFIALWVGDEYVVGTGMALVFALIIYLTVIRVVPNSFKQAAGIFYEDRYIPLTEVVVNIVFGVLGALLIGLEGVFLGLIASTLYLHAYAYPKYVYNKVLQIQPHRYIADLLPPLVATSVSALVAWCLSSRLTLGGVAGVLAAGSIAVFVVIVAFYVTFSRTAQYRYFKTLVSKKLGRFGSRRGQL